MLQMIDSMRKVTWSFQVCTVLNDGATRVFSDEHKVPYAYKGDQWIGYDDEESLELKVCNLV